MSELAVVICTYDNAAMLDRVLAALASQTAAREQWDVLVVDNNSGAETHDVLERHRANARVPGLRVVVEPIQGLTPARLRGVRETTAPWIAFVDDDCVLDEGWIDRALAFSRSHAECGGFGGPSCRPTSTSRRRCWPSEDGRSPNRTWATRSWLSTASWEPAWS